MTNGLIADPQSADTLHQIDSHDEKFLRIIADHSSESMVLLGADGILLYRSPSTHRLLGYGDRENIGRNAFDFLHPDDLPLARQLFERCLRTPGIQVEGQVRFLHKDGSWQWAEAVGTNLLTEPTVKAIVIRYRNITQRKRAEDEVAKRNRQLSVLYTISRATSQLLGLDQTLNNAMDVTLETLGIEVGAIFVLDSDGKTLRLSAHRGLSEEFAEAAQRVHLGDGMTGRAAAENRQIVLDRSDYSPSWKFSSLVAHDGFQTMISTPLCSSGVVVGILNLATCHKRNLSSEELELLIAVGQILGNSVQNARLYGAAQQELAERKRAENEVRLLHEHLQLVISNAPVILYALDRNGIFTLSEGKGLETLRLKAGEVVGQSAFDLYQDVPEALTSLRLALAGEYVRTTIEGRGLAFDAWYSPLRQQDGEVVGVIGVATDITERKQAEDALRESQERYRNLVELSPDMIAVHSEGKILYLNPAAAKLLGILNPQESVGRSLFEFVHSDFRHDLAMRLNQIYAAGEQRNIIETRFVRTDGQAVDVEVSSAPIIYEGKTARQVIVRNISKRRRVEKALTEQSRLLETFFRNTLTCIVLLDRDFNFIRVNEAYARACGRTVNDFPGHNHFEFYPSEAKAIFEEVVKTKRTYQTTARPFVFTDHPELGVTYWDWMLEPILDDQGEVDMLVFTLQDVTERKRAEETQTRLSSILEATTDFVSTATPEGRILYFNGAARKILGIGDGEDISNRVISAVHPAWAAQLIFNEGIPAALRDGAWSGETAMINHEGHEVPISQVILAHKEQTGNVEFLSTIARDITEHKRAEAERSRYTIQLQGLADASWAMNSTLALNDLFEIVAKKARQIIGAHLSAIRFAIGDSHSPSIQYVSASTKYERQQSEEMSDEDFLLLFGNLPPHNRLVTSLVERDGQSMGLIQLADKYDGRFTENDEAILEQLAQMSSTAIANVQLFVQVSAHRERLEGLSRLLVEVQESERRHIARELHDEVGQSLTGLKLLLEIAQNSPAETVRDHLTHTLALVEQIAAQIHDLSLDLRPPMLDDLGLLPALLGLFDHYSAQTGVEVILEHRGLKNQRFATEIETAAYRIVQEALTNVARHANVNQVVVRLWVVQNVLGVQIEDHGVGFELGAAFANRTSSGLSGMRERVTLLGGQFEVESKPEVGTTLTAQLPLS